jgi:putative ABC transport system permease protein
MPTLWRDLRFTLRGMRKSLAFVATAVITLALGIGANTAMFSVIRAVMLQPLPFREPDRLVYFSQENPARSVHDNQFGLPQFEILRTQARSFDSIAAYGVNPESFSISGDGREPEALRSARVSGNFLDVLGVHPVLGRSFQIDEDRRGAPCVAMISAGLWKRRFAGDPVIAGKTAMLDATACTIVGVLPAGFEFPFADVDVWVPRPSEWSALPERFWNIPLLKGFARLKSGVSLEQAGAEMQVLHAQYTASHVGMKWEEGSTMRTILLRDRLIADLRPMLWMLMGAVALVLLIACANVASLLLARGLARSNELAVQSALGAGRSRLIGQLLTESILLSIAGGAVGVLLAHWILAAVSAAGNLGRTSALALFVPRGGDIRLNGVVLAFTFVLCVLTGILFGLAPALNVSQPDLADMLRERTGAVSKSRSGVRFQSVLAIGQVALSVVLLIGAALLIESIARLRAVNPGFQPANLLTMKIPLAGGRYDTDQKRWTFFADLVQRVEALPGVRGAAMAMSLPSTGNNLNTNVWADGRPIIDAREMPSAQLQRITPDYFQTMGIPLKRGREFTAADNQLGARPVVIINESLARLLWPAYPDGPDPVGQHLFEGGDKLKAEIVGITGNVRERALSVDPTPEFYIPSSIHPPQTGYLAVRTDGDPIAWARAIRGEISTIDPDQAVSDVRSMETLFDLLLRQRHLTMELLSAFAGVALVLALIGIYGVTAYSVAQRTQEVGIRRALGAQHSDILRLVVGQGMLITSGGVAFGVAGAFALTRVLREFLFQVSATDPLIFAGIAALFLLVALLACLIPARRAARVDPMEALRLG